MSGFLSSKYLKYQQALFRERIEEDLHCVKCGYNVRGLTYGRACPECSAPIEPVSSRSWRLEPGLRYRTPDQRTP